MMKAAVLSFLIVGCSALRTQITRKASHEAEKTPVYSLKAKDQVESNRRIKKEEFATIAKEHSTGKMKDVGPLQDYIEMHYVNTKSKVGKARRQCMDKQLDEMGMKPHIFMAIKFDKCMKQQAAPGQPREDIVACLQKTGFGDCVKKGVDHQAIATHGSAGNEDFERAYKIVSNACSHKRMMSQMYDAYKEGKTKAKYAVLLEDDVAFDRRDFMRKVVNFIEMYDGKFNSTWQMVQIDPFGSKCDRHIVGHFEGLPVWKPSNVNNNYECSNYWGAHALLVKYEAMPKIIQHMELKPTVPLDWLPAELDHGLAWQANIAKNPEAINQYYGGQMHHQWVNFPDYCKGSVKQSTIGDTES